MPQLGQSVTTPKAGTISSFVLWHLQRGDSPAFILNRAASSRFRTNIRFVRSALKHWQRFTRYGESLGTVPDSTFVNTLNFPSRTGGRNVISVGLKATLNVPVGEGIQRGREISFRFDLDPSGTVGDLRNQARQKVLDWLQRYYEVRTDTLQRRKVSIEFTGVEAV